MKIFKNVDLKNGKVLFGLFSLLFIMSIVQTSAILKSQNSKQVAQVTNTTISSSSSDCLIIKQDVNKIFSNPFFVGDPRDYSFTVGVKITNNCIRPVSVIDSATLIPLNKDGLISSLNYMKIDRFDGVTGSPVVIENLSDFNIDAYTENASCVSCPSGSMQYRFSPAGTLQYQNSTAVRTFPLAVGETRKFEFMVEVGVPNNMEFGWWLRAKPVKLSWFYNSAYNDNFLSADEIRTKNFTAAEQNTLATDYTIIVQEGNPSTCPDGQSMALGEELEPICQ
jgi:hypothetical protein